MSVESRGEWAKAAKDVNFHPDPNKQDKIDPRSEAVRDTAIEQADLGELEGAVSRMEAALEQKPGDVKILEALARVRARVSKLIETGQN